MLKKRRSQHSPYIEQRGLIPNRKTCGKIRARYRPSRRGKQADQGWDLGGWEARILMVNALIQRSLAQINDMRKVIPDIPPGSLKTRKKSTSRSLDSRDSWDLSTREAKVPSVFVL